MTWIKDMKGGFMRKIFLFAVLILCFAVTSYAAPCYGTKMPGLKELFIGLQAHSILKRHLEDEYGKLRSMQYFFLISYGVYDWLSVDLKGGAGNINERSEAGNKMDYSTYLGGGYGERDSDRISFILFVTIFKLGRGRDKTENIFTGRDKEDV